MNKVGSYVVEIAGFERFLKTFCDIMSAMYKGWAGRMGMGGWVDGLVGWLGGGGMGEWAGGGGVGEWVGGSREHKT